MTTKKRWWGGATTGSMAALAGWAMQLPLGLVITMSLVGALLPWATGLLWLHWFARQSKDVRRDVLHLISLETGTDHPAVSSGKQRRKRPERR